MRLRRIAYAIPIDLAILRVAGLILPGAYRKEWLAEWRSELWYVRQECARRVSARGRRQPIIFCLGAFHDAFWLRRNSPRSSPARHFCSGSPIYCLLFLAIWGAITWSAALLLPGARKAILPSPYRTERNLVMISRTGLDEAPFPEITLGEYRSWTASTRVWFNELAFYRPIRERVRMAGRQTEELSVAQASDNLFELLKVPGFFPTRDLAEREHTAALVLSRTAWQRSFGGDPHIVGQVVEVGRQRARITAILPEDSWRLPGRMDAWLLEDSKDLAALPSAATGFLFAHVRASSAYIQPDGRWYMSAPNADGGRDSFVCVSLAEKLREPLILFLFGLALAALALPAITSLPLGEYPRNDDGSIGANRLHRWTFLFAKIAFLLPIVYCGSLDLAYLKPSFGLIASQWIQLIASFTGCLIGFCWALKDQRRRCPSCLRLLMNPARVGLPSRIFLAWNGTELICRGGHGLLHIPELPTSWFGMQRWLYLDSSWSSPVSEPTLSSAGSF